MIHLKFEIGCVVLKKCFFSSIFTFSKQLFLGIFLIFAKKHPKWQKLLKKRPKLSIWLIIFHISLKKSPLFDVDLFSWTFDMESPKSGSRVGQSLWGGRGGGVGGKTVIPFLWMKILFFTLPFTLFFQKEIHILYIVNQLKYVKTQLPYF